jgi:serine kinase of HPr protein (carbohydrate metabolism regulator)
MTTLIHATCVAIGARAVLLTGPSGAGKSDLALRLIDRGAVLVSDDQTALSVESDRLIAAAPATIAGKIEVRGLGIVAMPHLSPMPVALVIELSRPPLERIPEKRTRDLCGMAIPAIALDPFETSATVKAEMALQIHGMTLD